MGLNLQLDVAELKPLFKAIVAETIAELEAIRDTLPNRIAFNESEAADMLGLNRHQLRDLRYEGKISYSRGIGNRIFYQRSDLIDYLVARRVEVEK